MNSFLPAFDRQCQQRPESTALLHDNRSVSYAELDRLSRAIAERLAANDVIAGCSVALIGQRSIDMIAAMLDILRLGAAFVPIDPGFPDIARLQRPYTGRMWRSRGHRPDWRALYRWRCAG